MGCCCCCLIASRGFADASHLMYNLNLMTPPLSLSPGVLNCGGCDVGSQCINNQCVAQCSPILGPCKNSTDCCYSSSDTVRRAARRGAGRRGGISAETKPCCFHAARCHCCDLDETCRVVAADKQTPHQPNAGLPRRAADPYHYIPAPYLNLCQRRSSPNSSARAASARSATAAAARPTASAASATPSERCAADGRGEGMGPCLFIIRGWRLRRGAACCLSSFNPAPPRARPRPA